MYKVRSLALMRFFGFVLIGIFANYAAAYYARKIGIDQDLYKIAFSELGAANGFKIFGVGIAAGFVGLLIGQMFGSSIKVGRGLESWLLSFWHYGATGTPIWVIIFSLVLNFSGIDIKMANFSYWIPFICVGLMLSWIISILMNFGGKLVRKGMMSQGYFVCKPLVISICVSLGILQSLMADVNIFFGAIIGFVFPYITISISAMLRQADEERLAKMNLR